MTVGELIKRLKEYPPEMHCAYNLHLPEDVKSRADAANIKLTDKETNDILWDMNDNSLGVNWDVADFYIDNVVGKPAFRPSPIFNNEEE